MRTRLSCPAKSAGRTSGKVWVFCAGDTKGQPVRNARHGTAHAFIVHPPRDSSARCERGTILAGIEHAKPPPRRTRHHSTARAPRSRPGAEAILIEARPTKVRYRASESACTPPCGPGRGRCTTARPGPRSTPHGAPGAPRSRRRLRSGRRPRPHARAPTRDLRDAQDRTRDDANGYGRGGIADVTAGDRQGITRATNDLAGVQRRR